MRMVAQAPADGHTQRERRIVDRLDVHFPFEVEVVEAEHHLRGGCHSGAARRVAHHVQAFEAAAFLDDQPHAAQCHAPGFDLDEHALEAAVRIALHAVDRGVGLDAGVLQRRAVEVEEVRRVGDHPHRAVLRDRIEFVAVQVAALDGGVEAPGDHRLLRVGLLGVRRAQLGDDLLMGEQGRVDALRAGGVDRADVVQHQVAGRHRKMRMRVDQSGQDDLAFERAVDRVLVALEPGLHRFDAACGDDPAVHDGDCFGHRPARIHGDDLACGEHRDFAHGRTSLVDQLSRVAMRPASMLREAASSAAASVSHSAM